MKQLQSTISRLYEKYIFNHHIIVLICLVLILGVLGYHAKNFKIDASAESLLLENDKDLTYARKIYSRYGVHDFLIISYTPKNEDILSDKTLSSLKQLQNDLEQLKSVSSVLTIMDAPLLESPPVRYSELSEGNVRNLKSPDTDRNLAGTELRESVFYRNLLVSQDMKTTAIIVYLHPDEIYRNLTTKRNEYLEKQADGTLTSAEASELSEIYQQIRQHLDKVNRKQHQNITTVRAIMDNYRQDAELFLGGISMIADDMIVFIKNDLKIFGLGVFLLLIMAMGVIFRQLRWVVLPMLCCFLSVLAMMGVLGMFGWEVTVISSNFVSLQLILTLATVIHLMVRYRELAKKNPEWDQRTLVLSTIRLKFIPCLYSVMTTMAGFSSLLLCDILPVINFGWMMSAGIFLSLILTFILFPAGLMLTKKNSSPDSANSSPSPANGKEKFSFVSFLGRFTQAHGMVIILVTLILTVLTVMGISRLKVENSFIDYFKHSTEIYQGMKVIDQKLGGTTPLDIIVEFEKVPEDAVETASAEDDFLDGFEDTAEDDFLDGFEDTAEDDFLDGFENKAEDKDKYWFTDDKTETAEKVHDYLNSLPETGKVLSLGTLVKIARHLNEGDTLDSYEWSILYTKMPDNLKEIILRPYVSIEENEIRFSVRIMDSLKTLKRDALLKQIRRDLVSKLNLKNEHVHLTGTMVLYNNMLQSLFRSQIMTLGLVALALLTMFLVLFRSLKVALVAIFPNLLAAGSVLGVMGWLNIPLDMMTITIASISMGIAVDDTIHYIYRFREEIRTDNDYYKSLHRCHETIGHAMFYTSVTIIIGFSILVFSNFFPTIYFGMFTALAMLIAMVAALTLLPQLIVLFRPFGPGNSDS